MRKKALLALLAVLSTVLFAFAGVGVANASDSVQNVSGVMTGQKASSSDPGYYGRLSAKQGGTACVVAERKAAGGWEREGFWQGNYRLSEFRVCYNNWPAYEDYRVHEEYTGHTFGLRMVSNTGQIKVLCDDDANPASGDAWDCAVKLA